MSDPDLGEVTAWWASAITRIAPGEIEFRGHEIAELIRGSDFVSTIWLLVRGELPDETTRRLLDAVLVASADHGPMAPSIASARMAITCGVGINSAMANGVNVLGDTHGGAGQQCVELLVRLVADQRAGGDLSALASKVIADYRNDGSYVPGFGHRFHPHDPRREPLLELVHNAVDNAKLEGDALRAGLALEEALRAHAGREIPMNIDGISAIVYAELGVEPELARGLFALSRSTGILAHAWEERLTGRRIKGPLPPPLLADFTGPAPDLR